ncbi:MAG TPA: porphobilinogen synthase, partial [Gammaproteobacteria bacterium]|nr:porphobilinogen synthase [Gammaproteobacteria bacterium]
MDSHFPATRMRRMRKNRFSRALMREHRLSAADLIQPVFVIEGENNTESISSMPGVERLSIDLLCALGERLLSLGVPAVALFPVVGTDKKSDLAEQAYNPDGLAQRAV